MRLVLALLLLAAAAAPAAAQDEPLGPQEARRDGFGILLLTTNDDQGFLRAWAGPTPPRLETTTIAVRGAPIFGMLLFHGCRAGPEGNCNVTGEFSFLRPDGSPYGEPLRGDVWKAQPAPDGNIQLGTSGSALIVEPHDPAGSWTMRARITDNVRGLTLEVEQRITVETPPAAPVTA